MKEFWMLSIIEHLLKIYVTLWTWCCSWFNHFMAEVLKRVKFCKYKSMQQKLWMNEWNRWVCVKETAAVWVKAQAEDPLGHAHAVRRQLQDHYRLKKPCLILSLMLQSSANGTVWLPIDKQRPVFQVTQTLQMPQFAQSVRISITNT